MSTCSLVCTVCVRTSQRNIRLCTKLFLLLLVSKESNAVKAKLADKQVLVLGPHFAFPRLGYVPRGGELFQTEKEPAAFDNDRPRKSSM
jgi:hypothetical protein